jgi:secreted Zn-dependent insulinase-like peptidase
VQTAAASLGGLRCELSYNRRGVRLTVSGYAEKLPRLLALVLRRTLRHQPRTLDAPQMTAARSAGLTALSAERESIAAAGRDEIAHATVEQIEAEAGRLWKSVDSAQLLLVGALSFTAADAISSVVRTELSPLLPTAGLGPPQEQAAGAELGHWDGLLYRALWMPSLGAQNICLSPAVAATLDQCGGVASV